MAANNNMDDSDRPLVSPFPCNQSVDKMRMEFESNIMTQDWNTVRTLIQNEGIQKHFTANSSWKQSALDLAITFSAPRDILLHLIQDFNDAIRAKCWNTVISMSSYQALNNLNARWRFCTPLDLALQNQAPVYILQILITDDNKNGVERNHPLIYAIRTRQWDAVQYLLYKKVNRNVTDVIGRNALEVAITHAVLNRPNLEFSIVHFGDK